MPYKSKKQWKKFFAMAANGELPKSTAKEWANATKSPFSKLPEKTTVKKAYDAGYAKAMAEAGIGHKEASALPELLMQYGLPAAAGAYLAGPDNRMFGALGGLGAGMLGKHLARRGLASVSSDNPGVRQMLLDNTPANLRSMLTAPGTSTETQSVIKSFLGDLRPAQIGLGLAGGAGAGYGIRKATTPGPFDSPYAGTQPTTTYLMP